MKKIKYANLKKVTENTRLCFDCDNQYTSRKGDLPWLFCPYCGKKTFGFDLESFERLDEYYDHFEDNTIDENIEYIEKFIICLEMIKNDYLKRK